MALRRRIAQTVSKLLGVAEATPSGGGAKRDPSQSVVRRLGLAVGVDSSSSREFQPPDFDLTQITTAYDTEAYVRQAVDKYIELMFKAGWDIVGKNVNAVDYIKLRLKLIAEMSQIPTEQLFIEIAEDLVKYSNVIIAKARDNQNLLATTQTGLNVQGLGGAPPIVGYFPLNVTTMQLRRDRFGTVRAWQQEVEGQDRPVRYRVEDIVHIYYKREKGRAFGTPFLMPVLDDIRALRQAEENVLRLIYRNLNPLLHIQVGNDNIPGQQPEVDTVQTEFENLDLEAGFVTSERVAVNSVASDRIIDAKDYLKYFEQRVFTGLGVSELMMGRGNSANRSTGDNLSSEFTDRVKAFQKVMSIFVDEFMINELLLEGGFDPVLNPDDDVDFVFKEIDVDAKIKAENHALFLYEHNAITEDEMRAKLSLDPITDRSGMHLNIVTLPTHAAGKTSGDNSEDTNNRNQPTNQHGTKPSPERKESVKESYEAPVSSLDKLNEEIENALEETYAQISAKLERYFKTQDDQYLSDLASTIRHAEENVIESMMHYIDCEQIGERSNYIHKVFENLHRQIIEEALKMEGQENKERVFEVVNGIYEVTLYRVTEIANQIHIRLNESKEVGQIEEKHED